jgi:hypothetical protein
LAVKQLPAINAALRKKKMDGLRVLKQGDWEKMHRETSSSQPAGMRFREVD